MDDPTWREIAHQASVAGALGMLGRFVALARNNRPPLGWSLLWEVPMGIVMGWIGYGICQHYQFEQFQMVAVIVVTGAIGPRVIDELILRVAEKWLTK